MGLAIADVSRGDQQTQSSPVHGNGGEISEAAVEISRGRSTILVDVVGEQGLPGREPTGGDVFLDGGVFGEADGLGRSSAGKETGTPGNGQPVANSVSAEGSNGSSGGKGDRDRICDVNVVEFEVEWIVMVADVRNVCIALGLYKKASFEQDILLESQLPPPERFGLSSNALLEVVTEFFGAPHPKTDNTADAGGGSTAASAPAQTADPTLAFGAMTMGRGRAFVLGEQEASAATPVVKDWTQIGERQFLFEQVPLMQIRDAIRKLPAPKQSLNAIPGKIRRTAGRDGVFPKSRPGQATTNIMKMAEVKLRPETVVLDYTTLNTTLTNYYFRADLTYFISGTVNLSGTNTFEGGVVLKFATNGLIQAVPSPTPAIVWGGAAYRPVIFTAKDDDTVGDPISGSTGSPSGYYSNPMLLIVAPSASPTFTGFRMSYAKTGLSLTSGTFYLYDGQFVKCQSGIYASGGVTGWLGNALFSNVETNLLIGGGVSVKVQSATFDTSAYLAIGPASFSGSTFAFTNCIFANVTNLFAGVASTNGDYNAFFNSPYDARLGLNTFTNSSNPFQTVGGGNYYLSPDSNFQDAGTTNITADFLVRLGTKTTYPPILLANALLSSVDISLYPQV